MKPLFALLVLPFTAAIAVSPGSALAFADMKSYGASICQPYSTTTLPSELSFRAPMA